MHKIFKKILYKITRPYVKRYLTGNLGKIVESDDKIICYVNKRKIKKKKYEYTIACFGIRDTEKKLADAFNLNKPVCYVIDGINLEKHKTYIFGYDNCEVIIKKCNFGLGLDVDVNGKCTLDNTNITVFSYLYIRANSLVIKNMKEDQIDVISSKTNIGFEADNRIDIKDSNIGHKKKNVKVSLIAPNEINIVNSKIIGKEIEYKSNVVNTNEDGLLKATNKVNLYTEDVNLTDIEASKIILNGEEVSNEKNIVFKGIAEPLVLERLELISLLEKVKSQCENVNLGKVLKYEEELNEQPIRRILKKK